MGAILVGRFFIEYIGWLQVEGPIQNRSVRLIIQMITVGVNPKRPFSCPDGYGTGERTSGCWWDSDRGHLVGIIQAGGQAGASRITARRDPHR